MSKKGRIHHIETFNFKSYKGVQTIGPFKDFTAVIGPNGAGKSNLMDAISFVLGIRATQLRGTQLKDLIYRVYEGAEYKEGHVVLYFQALNDDGEEEEEIAFKRRITPKGSSEYLINDRKVTWEDYNDKLMEYNILIKARNFLVFQGDVESIASKSPKDLTELIEQISGSSELKKEYDELQLEKERAEETTIYNFQKKKGIVNEKKVYKEQKEEADRFNKLLNEQKAIQLDHMLFQLFHIEKRVERNNEKVAAEQAKLSDVEDKREVIDKQLKAKKKAQAKHHKEATEVLKKVSKKKKDLEKVEAPLVKMREEVARRTKRLEESAKNEEGLQAEFEDQSKEVESLESELEAILLRSKEFEEELKKREGEEKLDLQEDQIEEYNAKKAEAGAQTSKLKQDVEQIIRQQKLDIERRDALEAKLNELKARKAQLEETESQFESRQVKVEEFIANTQRKKTELEEQLDTISSANKRAAARQEELLKDIETIQEELKEAKVDIRSNERENRFNEALQSMKRLFTGVHGRMVDLVQPRASKYNVAMTVAMGRNMDAIIIDEEKTARDCIEYLREQRVGTATFLPLNSIKVRPVNEKLRDTLAASGTGSNLIIDVMNYDPAILKAVLYAVGNTVVCDSISEAKRLAFAKENGVKSVTLNGTLIRKNGLMTGGPGGVMAKAKRWDQKKVEALKSKRDKHLKELQEVGKDLRSVAKEQQLVNQIAGLEGRLKNFNIDLNLTQDKLNRATEEREEVEKQIQTVEPELENLTQTIEEREGSIASQTKKIHKLEDEIFKEFSRKVGLTNIRDYEEKRQAFEKEKNEKRLAFSNQESLLRNQLEYEKRKDLETPLKKLRKKRKEDQDKLKELKKAIKDAQGQEQALQSELKALNDQKDEAKKAIDDLETEIKELKKELNTCIQEAGSIQKAITATETEIEQLRMRRHTLYQRCKVEQIDLPRKRRADGASEEDSMSIDPSAEMEMESQALREIVEKEDELAVDFSKLNKKLMQAKDLEGLNKQFLAKLQGINLELQKIAPNLKASDQFDNVLERLKASESVFEEARDHAKSTAEKFDSMKAERYQRFMEAFDHISSRIDDIYKHLTQSNTHVGGTAFLHLENPDEPYLGGVKYNAMPPLKRFRDIEQLSGGEKTVAALALLFAIHSYQPSPFFVLDEIDAALDNHNIAKVVRYVRDRVDKDGLQVVVISLKDTFYSHADALVGIYRDQDNECSSTVTLSLEEYPED